MARRYRTDGRRGKRSAGSRQVAQRRRAGQTRQRRSRSPRDRAGHSRQAQEFQLPLSAEALTVMLREEVQRIAVESGLLIAGKLLEDEVTRLCGERYQRQGRWRRFIRYGE